MGLCQTVGILNSNLNGTTIGINGNICLIRQLGTRVEMSRLPSSKLLLREERFIVRLGSRGRFVGPHRFLSREEGQTPISVARTRGGKRLPRAPSGTSISTLRPLAAISRPHVQSFPSGPSSGSAPRSSPAPRRTRCRCAPPSGPAPTGPQRKSPRNRSR